MEIVRQGIKSSTCGQCCIAMITGFSLNDVFEAVGHDGGTSSKEIKKALRKLGFSCSRKTKRIGKKTVLPDLCILISRRKENFHIKNKWHWIVYFKGYIYDPWYKRPYEYKKYVKEKEIKITSYIEVKVKNKKKS